jgi:hypothetical protein
MGTEVIRLCHRLSGEKIAVTLKIPRKGEGKAQACENLLGTSIDSAQAFLYSAIANSSFARTLALEAYWVGTTTGVVRSLQPFVFSV